MLTIISRFLYCHLQAAMTSFNSLCGKPMATMLTTLIIAIALTLPTLLWVFADNITGLTNSWRQDSHISLYLKLSISEAEGLALLEKVKAMPGVDSAKLKTASECLAELQQQEGMHELIRDLPENPLPAVIEITPDLSLNDKPKITKLLNELEGYSEVEQVKADIDWLKKIQDFLSLFTTSAKTLMILLGFAVVLIIGNTLRLAINNRREEIQVLKLVGASDSFIAMPFLYSGIWYSLGGAVIAILLVNILLLTLTYSLQKLAIAYQLPYSMLGLSVKQAYLILSAAAFLGWLGAKLSVKSQLANIEFY